MGDGTRRTSSWRQRGLLEQAGAVIAATVMIAAQLGGVMMMTAAPQLYRRGVSGALGWPARAGSRGLRRISAVISFLTV